jgi:hypothetical protein
MKCTSIKLSPNNYTVMFTAHYSDGVSSQEQVVNVIAKSHSEAVKVGKMKLIEMNTDFVYNSFESCHLEEDFVYPSSRKEFN